MADSKLMRRTLRQQLLEELRGQILSGRLVPGETIPTERELCDAFGVGRTTVREALQGLVASGLAERRATRLIVSDPRRISDEEVDYSALASRTSVREVYETRKLLEVEMARLAALNHTEAELEDLRMLLKEMDPVDPATYHTVNERFHEAVAAMCRNRVLSEVYLSNAHLFFRLPAYWRLFGNRSSGRVPFPGGGLEGHIELYDAIASGDGERAAQVMFDHLDRVEKRLIERIATSRPDGEMPQAVEVDQGERE